MKPADRQTQILTLVARDGEARVEDLAAEFGVSAETIRRDLAHLAETGALQKVHGGARRLRLHSEGTFQERMTDHAAAKAVIAQKLLDVVEPGETLFIDTGSTTLIAARELRRVEGLTVITNSLAIARVFGEGDGGATVYLLGGRYGAANAQTAGPMVIDQVARFQADLAILTAAAVDAQAGAMDADFDEAQVAHAMAGKAGRTVVLAHADKIGRKAAFRICGLEEIDMLVTDAAVGDGFAAALHSAGVELR